MTKLQLQIVVADLIQEALDLGMSQQVIHYILSRNGMSNKDILQFYGVSNEREKK
jgi:hypothetical protein